MTNTQPRMTVAKYISQCIEASDKTQRQIAREAGWPHPNVLSMVKAGDTNLPLDRVGPLAKALEIDPIYLLRLTMNEYMPETFAAVEEAIGTTVLTRHERDIVDTYRELAEGTEMDVALVPLRGIRMICHEVNQCIRTALGSKAYRSSRASAPPSGSESGEV